MRLCIFHSYMRFSIQHIMGVITMTLPSSARRASVDGLLRRDGRDAGARLKKARAYIISIARAYLYGAPRVWADPRVYGTQFFRYPLSQSEADCLYRNGEFTVGVCQEVSKMDSLHYFQSFLPTERDFSGATIR